MISPHLFRKIVKSTRGRDALLPNLVIEEQSVHQVQQSALADTFSPAPYALQSLFLPDKSSRAQEYSPDESSFGMYGQSQHGRLRRRREPKGSVFEQFFIAITILFGGAIRPPAPPASRRSGLPIRSFRAVAAPTLKLKFRSSSSGDTTAGKASSVCGMQRSLD